MLRLVSDENFRGAVVRGLRLRAPGVDLVRVQDVGLLSAEDPAILAWAADQGRILLTHDRKTVPDFAYARLAAGLLMPGVFVVRRSLTVRQSIEELEIIVSGSTVDEWDGRVIFLPL